MLLDLNWMKGTQDIEKKRPNKTACKLTQFPGREA